MDQTGAPGSEEDEDTVVLDPFHFAREARPGHDLSAGLSLRGFGGTIPLTIASLSVGTLFEHRHANPFPLWLESQNLDRHRRAGRNGGLPPIPGPRRREHRQVR